MEELSRISTVDLEELMKEEEEKRKKRNRPETRDSGRRKRDNEMDDRERRKKERRNKMLALLPPLVGTLFILLAIAGGTLVARHIDKPIATPEPTSKVTVIPARAPGPAVRPEISSMRLTVYGEALGPDGFTAYVGDKITLTLEITPQFINPPVIWSYSDPGSVNLKPGDDRLTCVFTALKPTGKNELSVKCYDTEIVIPVYLWER